MTITKNSQIDLNGNEMILDADGDTTITADTDDQIDFKTGGTDRAQINSTGDFLVRQTSADVYDTNSGGSVRQFWGNQFSAQNNGNSRVIIGSASNKGLVGGATVNSGGTKPIVNSYMAFESIDQTAGGEDGVIAFYTSTGGGSGTEQMRLTNAGNLHLSGGSDRRIQLGNGGAGANQVSNNTVHIRADGADMKLMSASGGSYLFESNGSELMRINNSGDVAIGSATDGTRLYVYDNSPGNYLGIFYHDGNDNDRYGIRILAGSDSATTGQFWIRFDDGDGHAQGYIYHDSGSVVINQASDERLKENIVDSTLEGINTLKNIKQREFNWKRDADKTKVIGYIAQELESVYPVAVVTNADKSGEGTTAPEDDPDNPYKYLLKERLIDVLIKAGQEQQVIIEDLKARIETLEGG